MANILASLGASSAQAGLFGVLQPFLNVLQYGSYTAMPTRILEPPVLVEAYLRNKIGEFEYLVGMRANGYEEQMAKKIFSLTDQYLNGAELIAAKRRGFITETKYESEMANLGWSGEAKTYYEDVTKPIPSPQDIIAFAVREVYNPEIAQQFGQYEGLGPVLENARKDILATGMTEDTFKKYWAAHWMLPGLQQGFEMLHRQSIDRKTMDTMFQALDVMPYFRDKLTDIAYNPLTRVDVRRMHKLGVLTEFEVFSAYADLGYDINFEGTTYDTHKEAYDNQVTRTYSNAGKMLSFTLMYNDSPEIMEMTADEQRNDNEKDLTKADILKAYNYRIFNGEETIAGLYWIGYSMTEAEYYIQIEDAKKADAYQDKIMSVVHDGYTKGVLTKNEAQTKLNEAQLQGEHTLELFDIWDIEKSTLHKGPTKAEVLGFFKSGLIEEGEAREELMKQNYAPKYVEWFIESTKRTIKT